MVFRLLIMKSDLSFRNGVLLYKQLIRPIMVTRAPRGGPLPAPMSGGCRCYHSNVSALLLCLLVLK
jgi:hypothetical protein